MTKVLIGLGGAVVLGGVLAMVTRKRAVAATFPAGMPAPVETLSPAQQQQVYDAAARSSSSDEKGLENVIKTSSDLINVYKGGAYGSPVANVQPVARVTRGSLTPYAQQTMLKSADKVTSTVLNLRDSILSQTPR